MIELDGLGPTAVKIAKALGADVTVLSRSARKREDAVRVCAANFVVTTNPDAFTQLQRRFDSCSTPFDPT